MERVAKERERARELASRVTLPVISLRGERECFESGNAGERTSGENSKEKGAASSGGGRRGEGGRGMGMTMVKGRGTEVGVGGSEPSKEEVEGERERNGSRRSRRRVG